MKTYVSNIPFENLKIGTPVISAIGNAGKITKLIPREQAYRNEDNDVVIEWDNGKISEIWHVWCTNIEIVI